MSHFFALIIVFLQQSATCHDASTREFKVTFYEEIGHEQIVIIIEATVCSLDVFCIKQSASMSTIKPSLFLL